MLGLQSQNILWVAVRVRYIFVVNEVKVKARVMPAGHRGGPGSTGRSGMHGAEGSH